MRQSAFCRSLFMAAGIFYLTCEALAINLKVANIGYRYGDEDIREVLQNRLGTGSYIAPAVPNSLELIEDVVRAAIAEIQAGRPALIPVNLGNNHWTALALRMNAAGEIIVFYNDSLGRPAGGRESESGKYLSAIRKQLQNAKISNAKIFDLRVRQQSDGSSCGAFTAESLIALANLPDAQLTAEGAKAELAKINNAGTIRFLHLNTLGGF